jgi:hypothetical protein
MRRRPAGLPTEGLLPRDAISGLPKSIEELLGKNKQDAEAPVT